MSELVRSVKRETFPEPQVGTWATRQHCRYRDIFWYCHALWCDFPTGQANITNCIMFCVQTCSYQMPTLLSHMEISKQPCPCYELSSKWNLPHLSNTYFSIRFVKLDYLSLFHAYSQSTCSLIQVTRNGKFFYVQVHFILVLLQNLWIIVVGTDLPCLSLKMWLMSYSAPAKLPLSVIVSTVLICYLSYFLSPDLEGCSQPLICIEVN